MSMFTIPFILSKSPGKKFSFEIFKPRPGLSYRDAHIMAVNFT